MINFLTIPLTLYDPGQYIEISNQRATRGLPAMPSRILAFGQMTAAGTAVANTPVQITIASNVDALFGRGSMLSRTLKAIQKANAWTELWALPQSDNAAGTAAVTEVTITGTATAAGTQNMYVDGILVQFAVTAGMTAAQAATALQAAIGAVQADLGYTSVVATATHVDLTSVHKGADVASSTSLRSKLYPSDADVPGLTFASSVITPGAGNPSLTASLAALGSTWFTDWIMPYTDANSMAALNAAVETLWGPTVMRDVSVWSAMAGTVGALAAADTWNEKLLTVMGVTNPPQPVWLWAAVLGAQAAYYGNIDPGRTLQDIPLTGILAPAAADRFDGPTRNLLLQDGIATWKVDAGGNVLISRAVTTYLTNAAGITDRSYLDSETLRLVAYLRFSMRQRIAQRFPRYRLADDGAKLDPGVAVVTPSVIHQELIALAMDWLTAGLISDLAGFKQGLLVERDLNDANTVNALLPPKITGNFRVFKGQIQFLM
jgi:phage tail sheath gpL-like